MIIHPVILCGGLGTRLWPLSTPDCPKQFLPLPQGRQSIFQGTLERLSHPPFAAATLVGNSQHKLLIEKQTAHCRPRACIFEPDSRNTGMSVALPVHDFLNASESEAVLLFSPADHFIKDEKALYNEIPSAYQLALDGHIVIFGQEPTSPETGYGYIEKGDALEAQGSFFKVKSFKEKPSQEVAQSYLNSGNYLWNTGMFLAKVSTLAEKMRQICPDIFAAAGEALAGGEEKKFLCRCIEAQREAFESAPAESIDYCFMEKNEHAVVVALKNSGWCDLGSWHALSQVAHKDENGNSAFGDVVLSNVKDSYIYSDSRLVCAVGLKDMIVVETQENVLLIAKDQAHTMKSVLEQLKRRPALAEKREDASQRVHRPWGFYESLERKESYQLKRIVVNPGGVLSMQMHMHRSEHWIVVEGTAIATLEDKEYTLTKDGSIYVPKKTKHRLENPSETDPLVLFEVQSGDYLGEDDIIRFEDKYGRSCLSPEEVSQIPG